MCAFLLSGLQNCALTAYFLYMIQRYRVRYLRSLYLNFEPCGGCGECECNNGLRVHQNPEHVLGVRDSIFQ